MSTLLPPSLVISPRDEAQNASTSQSKATPPNLMPFDIDYTGPANVDGYLVTHTDSKDVTYSHFRGRRIYNTEVKLPDHWIGNVYSVRRDQSLDLPESSSAAQERQDKERQRILLQQQRKKRKLDARPTSEAKPKAVMTSFSMDDDDEEDENEGSQDQPAGEEEYDEDDDDQQYPDDLQSPQLEDSASPVPEAKLPVKTTTLTPIFPEPFRHINIWNPDGPLDMGDDELVKVLSEWNAVRDLVSGR